MRLHWGVCQNGLRIDVGVVRKVHKSCKFKEKKLVWFNYRCTVSVYSRFKNMFRSVNWIKLITLQCMQIQSFCVHKLLLLLFCLFCHDKKKSRKQARQIINRENIVEESPIRTLSWKHRVLLFTSRVKATSIWVAPQKASSSLCLFLVPTELCLIGPFCRCRA